MARATSPASWGRLSRCGSRQRRARRTRPLSAFDVESRWNEAALVRAHAVAPNLRESPVHHADLAEGAHHDVRRLQVAMDDATAVRVRERLADLLEDRDEAAEIDGWVRPVGEQRREGPAPY